MRPASDGRRETIMIRVLFNVAKTFVVVKAVDAVIGAFTRPRPPRRARSVAASAARPATRSPRRAASKRRSTA